MPLYISAQTEPNVIPSQERGLYAIWYSKDAHVLDLPYIKGGQIIMQWADLEPARDKYDFATLDAQLTKMQKLGKMTTVQVNGNQKPAWLYNEVPFHPEKLSPQIADKQGTLMYWHPVFKRAYSDFIKAYARHLKGSPGLSILTGVRMNFNALGTEHSDIPQNKRGLNQWILPGGVKQGAEWSNEAAKEYQALIAETFITAFDGVKLFMRNNLQDGLVLKYDPLFQTGKLMWFHTSSEMEPRGGASERKQVLFRDYAGSGKTLAYAESWADSWGIHGIKKDPRWVSPPKWNYWRLLFDLNTGVSMPAVYGNDLEVAYSGKHPVFSNFTSYQSEFIKAFKFIAHYAGYHASPERSPGAWIAFRHNEKNVFYDSLNTFTGNYSFLINQDLPDDTGPAVTNIGPEEQRFGAWAKRLTAGNQIRLMLSNIFANSLNGKKAVVRVIYFDDKTGSFETSFSGQSVKTDLQGTGRWKIIELPVAAAKFLKNENDPHITLTALSGDVAFHMVNVERGDGIPHEVGNISVERNEKGTVIRWKSPSDFDLDAIRIYEGTHLIKSIAGNEEQVKIPDLSTGNKNNLTIKTVDEAGRESAGLPVKISNI